MTQHNPIPSERALVPFVSVDHMVKLINTITLPKMIAGVARYIEEDFKRWEMFAKTSRVPAHAKEGVIELMPTNDDQLYSFKYVNGHPANMKRGYQTVAAFGLLARMETGYPILLTEMTLLTAIRTAATSAIVAKYLAPQNPQTMAIIGNGAQSEFQAIAFQELLGIKTVHLYDIDPKATKKAMHNLEGTGLRIVPCQSAAEAVTGAQIITTCTASKERATILSDNMIGSGVHINGIGGDCPGKTEIHKDVLLRADIFVEHTPQTRIEGEIQQLDPEHPVTEMWQVLTEQAQGRTNEHQITLFDSVGFAIEDFSAIRYIHDQLAQYPFYENLDMLADPDEVRDLYGMIIRAQTPE